MKLNKGNKMSKEKNKELFGEDDVYYIEEDAPSNGKLFFMDLLFDDLSDDIQEDILQLTGKTKKFWKGKPIGSCQFEVEKIND